MSLSQDMHVHSTFSDGRDTIEDNVAEAERLGLVEMTCVDHVRVDSDWVADFTTCVKRANAATPVALSCGIEAKLLNTAGDLDLPPDIAGAQAIYIADHQVPLADGPRTPGEVRQLIETDLLEGRSVLDAIATSTTNALLRNRSVVIAHLFSVLPKLGLEEANVPLELVEQIASAAALSGARIEISERWRCPSARTLRPFLSRGVGILLSTDSHRSDTIGRYSYCNSVTRELEGVHEAAPG